MKLKENFTLILLGFSLVALIGLGAIVVLKPAFLTGLKEEEKASPSSSNIRLLEKTEEETKQPEIYESQPVESCQIAFNVPTSTSTPTPTATPIPTNSPTPIPTNSPTPIPTITPTPPSSVASSPSPTPVTLQEAGLELPTFGIAGGGLLLLLTSLLFLL